MADSVPSGIAVRPSWQRRQRQTLFGMVLVLTMGLLVRALALYQMLESPWSAELILDERITHLQALSFAGEGTLSTTTPFEFPPVPAWITSVLYRMAGPDPAILRLQSFVYGVVAVGLVFLLVRRLSPRRLWPAVLAASFIALHGPSILNSTVCMKTELVAVLLLGGALALSSRHVALAALAGVLWSAAFLSQGQTLPFLIAGGLVLLRRRRRLLGFLLGAAVVVGPVCLAQAHRGAAFPWLPVQAGTNFYFSNQPGSTAPLYRPTAFSSSAPELQIPHMWLAAEQRVGHALTAQEADAFWRKAAIDGMLDEPGVALKRLGKKIAVTFLPHENCDHYSLSVVARDVPMLRAPWPSSTWALVLAALLGPLAWRSRRCRPLILGLGGSLMVLVLTSPTARYRTVLVPCAAIVAAVGAARMRQPRWVAGAATVAGIAAFLPISIVGDDDSGALNARALVLDRVGRALEAQRSLEESRALDGLFSDYARLQLANGVPADRALPLLDEIDPSSFALALAESARCRLASDAGDAGRARDSCDRASRLQPGSLDACLGWADVVRTGGMPREAQTAADRCHALYARLRQIAPFAYLDRVP
jgi:hypothetical protein